MLLKRQLFKHEGRLYRLLEVSTNGSRPQAHIISIADKSALPTQIAWEQIKDNKAVPETQLSLRLKAGTNTRQKSSSTTDDSEEPKSASDTVEDKRWLAIKDLIVNPKIYFRRHRGGLIQGQAKTIGLSDRSIMHYLRLYWQRGMTKEALHGNFENCGPNPKKLEKSNSVVGRIPDGNRYNKFQWTPTLKKQITKFVTKEFLKSRLNSKSHCYRHVISKFFCAGKGKSKQSLPLGERPTRSQIDYLIASQIPLKRLLIREHSIDGYAKDVAPKTRSAKHVSRFIGKFFEIDATKPDVIIVDEFDRSIALGKCTLYLVVDARSFLILGFHLTLDNPSWDAAKEAILSISEDKQQLCTRWGIDYNPADWPAHGAWPLIWRADRGPELFGYDSDSIAEGLEGIIENLPRRRPNFKPFAEFPFKFVHVCIRSIIGGYTPPENFGKRQVENPGKSATRTLKELGREILEAVILWNHRAPDARRTDATLAELKAGFTGSPVEIWRRDSETTAAALASYDPTYLRFKLLPSESNFLVTRNGVTKDGLRWVPSPADIDRWLVPAIKSSYLTAATFKRGLVDCIYVHDRSDPSKWTTMTLADSHLKFKGMTFEQAKAYNFELTKINDELTTANLSAAVRYQDGLRDREKIARGKKLSASREHARKKSGPSPEQRRESARANSHNLEPKLPNSPSASPLPINGANFNADKPDRNSNTSKLDNSPVNNGLSALLRLKR